MLYFKWFVCNKSQSLKMLHIRSFNHDCSIWNENCHFKWDFPNKIRNKSSICTFFPFHRYIEWRSRRIPCSRGEDEEPDSRWPSLESIWRNIRTTHFLNWSDKLQVKICYKSTTRNPLKKTVTSGRALAAYFGIPST